MNEQTIVIVGGGVGGIVTANELHRRLASDSHHVILVEKNATHAFAPSFLWLMSGDRTPEEIVRPVRTLVHPDVEIVLGEVTRVDVASRTVGVGNQSLEADYIVIALGAELVPELIPGLAEASFSFYAFEDAKRLRDALVRVQGGSIAVVVSALPYKCPGAPHEAAMLLANDFRRRGLKDKVTVHLYTPEPQPMPVAGPQLGEAVTRMLASKGVVFHPLHKLTAVDANARKLHFDGKDPASYDMLIAIPPHRGSAIVREAGLANEAGWIPVDRFTFETKHERIYAIGDITTVAIPGRWKADVPMMLPKAGVFAHQQGSVVARRIADAIRGAAPETRFGGSGYCMLEAGEDLAGFAFGDFYAEPTPRLELREVGKAWHLGKVLFEQWWLSPLGVR